MFIVHVLGLVGSFLSMISNIPQAWKVRHANTTKDLHPYSVVMHFTSACVWSAYGFLLDLYILGIESGIVAFLYFLILLAIIRDHKWSQIRTQHALPVTQSDSEPQQTLKSKNDTI